jgi:hypothetical protein
MLAWEGLGVSELNRKTDDPPGLMGVALMEFGVVEFAAPA